MDTSPEKYILRLTENSVKKYGLLQNFLSLTKDQAKSITEDGVDTLKKAILYKQKIIEEIDKLDDEFELYFKRLKQELGINSMDELKDPNLQGAKELQQIIGSIIKIVNEINEIDKHNNEKAKNLLTSLGDEVKKISQGKKMYSAYRPNPVQIPSYYIDKKK
ncbi:MAG: flagellar protein FlgN [Bacillota bacterium]|nr:flagellar protein FlgN [Bacillota bacterium]